jgi:hypothetical protein
VLAAASRSILCVCCGDFEILKRLGQKFAANGVVELCAGVHVPIWTRTAGTYGGREEGSQHSVVSQRCVPAQKSARSVKLNSSVQICWAAGARDLIREVLQFVDGSRAC